MAKLLIILYKSVMIFKKNNLFSAFRLMPYKRRFNLAPMVDNIGFLPRNTAQVNATHPKFNFVFVLRGNGHFHVGRKRHAVTAPCVFTHVPGLRIQSGPETTWDEIYFSYPKQFTAVFMRMRLLTPERPIWPITNLPVIEKEMMTLSEKTAVNCLG